jgi:hypothetical protein
MTLRDLAHIALRIGAVIIIVDILVSLPMAFTAARYYAPAVIRLEVVETVLPPYALSLCGAVLMYVFAGKIVDWTVLRGKPEAMTGAPADLGGLERIAVTILGLYLSIMGLADIVHALIRFAALKLAVGNLPYKADSFVYAPDNASLGAAIFRIVVGGCLVCNGDAFMRLKDKLRSKRGIAGEES